MTFSHTTSQLYVYGFDSILPQHDNIPDALSTLSFYKGRKTTSVSLLV